MRKTVLLSFIILSLLTSCKRVSLYTESFEKLPTAKEFLMHSIEPLGTTLYIFGGGWAYDEECGDTNSMTHGIALSWKEFFDSQNEWFVYKNSKKKATSYFPFDGKNTHHEKGLDCTGYLGWLFYNTFEKGGSTRNYVYTTSKWLDTFTNDLKLGTKEVPEGSFLEISKHLKPTDVVVIDGHAYIVIGKCSDDSIVIIHSSVSNSITGAYGGGVQLSAINVRSSENKNCKAYDLADYYMATYCPEWHKRYPTVVKPTPKYLSFKDKSVRFGIFHFDFQHILSDPDNILDMPTECILDLVFH